MKKTNRSDIFKPLLTELSRAEYESIIRHVEAHQDFDSESRKLALEILNSLENNLDQSEEQLFKRLKINKLKPVLRYSLLRKIRILILEALSLQVNIDRLGNYGNAYRQRASNARKWIQATVLIEKNKIKEAQKILDDIQSKALKYEHFDQMAQAAETSLLLAATESTRKTLDNIEKVLNDAREKRNTLESATVIYIKARSTNFRKNAAVKSSLEQAYQELQSLPNGNDIATISYYKRVLQSDLARFNGELENWVQASIELVSICTSVPALQSSERIFYHLNDLVSAYIAQHEFKNAAVAIEEAQKLIKRDSFAFFDLQMKDIQIQLYQKKFEAVTTDMATLLKSRYADKLPFALSYYTYFMAAADFYSGNASNAVKAVLELMDENLANDPKLDLMNAFLAIQIGEAMRGDVDLQKSNEILAKALAKLTELKQHGNLDKRDSDLLTVFFDMTEHDFNPKKGNWVKHLTKMRNGNSSQWKPVVLENFPLDEWAQAKADKRKLWMKIPGSVLEGQAN